ncbi:uncharacterized protein MICPUCDRAFT_53429 [Micromonas pusilla CCMP1545]|jgi:hypothetical protein|uniref:Uncharacterized protein n=1 Tax=Micromonas pusilla (strain CCMP1545) TaxID=564608 RepID=C1N6T1_MICPC|nr:uncharacterized protein MICPUCDRAFT_53429 [Micromonas pusilla CCMP1545]EEH51980.1 hypothetical protein MICPUCDRAFT_53429 [Micromonas pusilla CCMP1545]|eukprot:XP_003063607.1 hypothetical protein MICPUCDRAFT_53429 [Micromonas pusilla CCMP1545]
MSRRALRGPIGGVPLQVIGADFYAKVVGISFATGACMELFMIKTGFYDKVTEIEAERRHALSEPPAWVLELQRQDQEYRAAREAAAKANAEKK